MSKNTPKNTQENTGTFLESECKILHIQYRPCTLSSMAMISRPQVILK